MKKSKEKKILKNSGITLIALIVTIIILLVLAGITVATLTGENGLISKSGEAKKQTEISEGLEQLEIAVTQSTNKRGNIDATKLAKNLSKIKGIKYINSEKEEVDITENTEIELTAKVKLKGYNYKINDEGKVSYKKEGAIDNEDIMESPETYYGKYVTNYNSLSDAGINAEEDKKWQIFLADDTNIYLIASNAIHKNYAPLNYSNNGDYNMSFSNILDVYDTSTIGNPSVASILGKLNKQSQYHEWLNIPTNLKNYNSQKAILSMLDTNKWSEHSDGSNNSRGFNNSTYADYVIGGPTLEMFCKSYNETHEGDDIIPKPKNNQGTYYTYGYKIKKGSTDEAKAVSDLKSSTQTELVSDINSMYFKCHYWIASPSVHNDNNILRVDYTGGVRRGETSQSFAIRPLVCLKSDVHLIEKTNGNTTTYELELD